MGNETIGKVRFLPTTSAILSNFLKNDPVEQNC